jgi:hypothetical protein
MPANYVLLERIELNASAASVTFSSIPQSGYTDLLIVHSSRVNDSGNADMSIQFNGNTSAVYSFRRLNASGLATSSDSGSSNALFGLAGLANGTSSTSSTFGNSYVYIPNYTSSVAKSWSYDSVVETNATTGNNLALGACIWNPSPQAAITSILIRAYSGSDILANSTFSLYGLADVNTTPTIAPKASGGNIIATDGTYWYHAFLSTGAFVPASGLSCDVMVVAGGGGGGAGGGAGGAGAGGFRVVNQSVATSTSYTVTVGSGGATNAGGIPGGAGSNSSFIGTAVSISSTGGGGGGTSGGNGANGGSGGGAGHAPASGGTGNAGSYSPSEGSNGGGAGAASGFYAAGGGGGASAAGAAGNSAVGGGNGGAGTNTYSSWASATSTGVSGYYAGGGGGGVFGAGSLGTGGAGGGGTSAVAGTTNTGGGGGGGSLSPTRNPGTGGSGIVIIRYPIA